MKVRNAVRCFLIENDKVLVTRYKEGNKKAEYYDIPGGKIEENEYPRDTAIREFEEETGMEIKDLTYKGEMSVEYPDRKFIFQIFRTNTYSGEPQEFEENISEWMTIKELLTKQKRLSNIILLEQKYISYLLDNKSKIYIYIKVDENEKILDVQLEILDNGVKQDLKDYIEKEIFPVYDKNEKGHGIEHIYSVINRSLKIAKEYNVDKNIVYTVAAYHDIGHHINPKIHEKLSAEIFMKDNIIKKWFSKEEIEIIKEAIEDHRASSDHEPKSLYGKIISTADRTIESIDTCIKRTYLYGKRNYPEKTEKEQIDRIYEHLNEKYGKNGYAKTYLYNEEFQIYKMAFIKALSDKETFMERVNKVVSEMQQGKK